MIEAGLTPSQVDSINSHATSTVAGDQAEANIIKNLFGNKDVWADFDKFKTIHSSTLVQNKEICKD